jgi:hypothetical protein
VWSLGIGCSMLGGHWETFRLLLGTGFCVLKSRHTIFLRTMVVVKEGGVLVFPNQKTNSGNDRRG